MCNLAKVKICEGKQEALIATLVVKPSGLDHLLFSH